MSFAKSQRILNQSNNYNPPPGYYNSFQPSKFENPIIQENIQTFPKQERFRQYKNKKPNPGPGDYFHDKQYKKRVFEQYKQKDQKNTTVKINSIPSIPKQSSSRIYQQLAPGILVLHQTEEENNNIGPGYYNPKVISKKTPAAIINPQHKKKFIQPIQNQLEQAASFYNKVAKQPKKQQKRIIKTSPLKPTQNNDLCLELIVLRQKQLKQSTNPPPGHYYNQKNHSSFQVQEKPINMQFLSGKMQRFDYLPQSEIGPGKYQFQNIFSKNNGFLIPKSKRKSLASQNIVPGPGTYKIQEKQVEIPISKTKYPPIFGFSGARFNYSSQKSDHPGPGSYNIQKKFKKRPKTIIIKDVKEIGNISLDADKKGKQNQELSNMIISPQNQQFLNKAVILHKGARKSLKNATSYIFSSKQRRFNDGKSTQLGPGKYQIQNLTDKTFNKRQNLMQKQRRFVYRSQRVKIGPGTYQIKDEIVRNKKIYDIHIN